MATGFVDQGLSSASNVFVVMAAARVSGVGEFGVLALALASLTTALALARGCLGTPLLLAGSGGPLGVADELRYALTASLLIGGILSGALAVLGAITGHSSITLPVALAVPFVLAQDVHRFAAMAARNPRLAVLWDGVWFAGSAAVLVTTWLSRGLLQLTSVLMIWTLLGGISWIGFTANSGIVPKFRGLVEWWRPNRADRLRYGLEAGVGAVSALIVASVSSLLIGVSATAALRGAGTVMGPVSVLISALPLAVLPEAGRVGHSTAQTRRLLRRIATAMSVLALVAGVAGYVLPDSWGLLFLGDTWVLAAPLLPIIAVEYAGLAWLSVTYTELKVQGRSARLLGVQGIYSAVTVSSAVLASLIYPRAMSVSIALACSAVTVAFLLRGTAGTRDAPVPSI